MRIDLINYNSLLSKLFVHLFSVLHGYVQCVCMQSESSEVCLFSIGCRKRKEDSHQVTHLLALSSKCHEMSFLYKGSINLMNTRKSKLEIRKKIWALNRIWIPYPV